MQVLCFLLQGHVQKVKMRRYVESAGRHLQVQGYVINTKDGDVFGEAWSLENNTESLDAFQTWIRGDWPSPVYTDVKPTPLGTAYPSKATVDRCITSLMDDRDNGLINRFPKFTMVRDDEEASELLSERENILQQLFSLNNPNSITSWKK